MAPVSSIYGPLPLFIFLYRTSHLTGGPMLVVLIADGRRRNGEWYYLSRLPREEEKGTKFSWNWLHLHLVSLFFPCFDGILIQWLISFRPSQRRKRVYNIPYISPVFTIPKSSVASHPIRQPSCPTHIYPSRARFIFYFLEQVFFFFFFFSLFSFV